MLEILLIIVVLVAVYFIFIKKGTGGNSFFKHKKELNRSIDEQGGMVEIFRDFVEYLKNRGFEIDKEGKDHLDLKYSSKNLVVEVQIIQVNFNETNISIQKRSNGTSASAGIVITSYDKLKKNAEELLRQGLTEDEIKQFQLEKNKRVKNPRGTEENYDPAKDKKLNEAIDSEQKLSTVQSQEELEDRANQLYKNGQFEEAKNIYFKIHKHDQTNIKTILQMADCSQKLGQTEKAQKLCRQAISIDPNEPHSYLVLANLYIQQNKYKKALKYLKEGKDLGSKGCEELYNRLKNEIKDDSEVNDNSNSSNPLIITSIYHIPLTSDTCISFKQKINDEWITATYHDDPRHLKNVIPAVSSQIENAEMVTKDIDELNISDPTFMVGSRQCKGRIRVHETHQADMAQHTDLESYAKQNDDEKYLVRNGKLIFRNTKIVLEGIDKEYYSENVFIEADGFVDDPASEAKHEYKNKLYIGEQEV